MSLNVRYPWSPPRLTVGEKNRVDLNKKITFIIMAITDLFHLVLLLQTYQSQYETYITRLSPSTDKSVPKADVVFSQTGTVVSFSTDFQQEGIISKNLVML